MTKSSPYHHGALREGLLTAAETILQRDGLNALTLRAAAREAGVTHAAPGYHFGDLTGLLSELAAVGFRRFSERMSIARAAPDKRRDSARAYLAFARENPALFQLMFRSDRLDDDRPALVEARRSAGEVLSDTAGATLENPSLAQIGSMLRNWSFIHGFTMLWLDGRLQRPLAMAPAGTTTEDLLDAMIDTISPPRAPGVLQPSDPEDG